MARRLPHREDPARAASGSGVCGSCWSRENGNVHPWRIPGPWAGEEGFVVRHSSPATYESTALCKEFMQQIGPKRGKPGGEIVSEIEHISSVSKLKDSPASGRKMVGRGHFLVMAWGWGSSRQDAVRVARDDTGACGRRHAASLDFMLKELGGLKVVDHGSDLVRQQCARRVWQQQLH